MNKKILRVAKTDNVKKESIDLGIDFISVGDEMYLEPSHTRIPLEDTYLNKLMSLDDYDIIELKKNGIEILFDSKSTENAILVTNKCNSNCVMCPCSNLWRNMTLNTTTDDNLQLLRLIPKNTQYLCLTGGEPTLARDGFIELLSFIKDNLNLSKLIVLTNGRTLSNKQFFDAVNENAPKKTRFAIPIYSYCPERHDRITNSNNSFEQASIGIKRLLLAKREVEIRIVINKLNYEDLEMTADYIISNFKGVASVNFMAMEMMGAALANRDSVWLDYNECFLASRLAIRKLVRAGFNVELYNFPLCKVEKGYWNICSKSISDYKSKFLPICNECSMKQRCGGVFSSTLAVSKMELIPIKEEKHD